MGTTASRLYRSWWEHWSYIFFRVVMRAPPLTAHNPGYSERTLRKKTLTFDPFGQRRAVVLVCHTSNTDAEHLAVQMQDLANSCHVMVIVYEYPGYGWLRRRLTGDPAVDQGMFAITQHSISDICSEAVQVLDNVVQMNVELNNNNNNVPIIVIGSGMGTVTALHMVAERPTKVAALFLHNTLSCWSDLVWSVSKGFWLVEANLFDNEAEAQRLVNFSGPIRLVHGKKDTLMPLLYVYNVVDALEHATQYKVSFTCRADWDHHVSWKEVQQTELVPWLTGFLKVQQAAAVSIPVHNERVPLK